MPAGAQTANATSSLHGTIHGTIRDPQGNVLAKVNVQLQSKDATQTQIAHTDAQGHYAFTPLHSGVFNLHASLAGCGEADAPSIFLAPGQDKIIDLRLAANVPDSQAASPSAPQFFDQPSFAVSGVTDTTTLGGHGSDNLVRTRENMAKDTAALAKLAPAPTLTAAETSENSLRDALAREPNSFDANRRLGIALLARGKPTEAIPYLARAAKINPKDDHNAYDLAQAYAATGDYQHALEAAKSLVARNENDAAFHHLLGDVHENLSDPLDAVREFQRAAELDPTEPYLFDWGSELLLHHAPEPALEVFRDGHRRFPSSARLLIGMGAAWFAQGSNDQAAQTICEAADVNPADPAPYLFLGKMLGAVAAPSDQITDRLHRFATLDPQNPQANYYYAVALWKQRKLDGAALVAQEESLLAKSIQLDGAFPPAHLQLGIVYADQRDFPHAIAEYQQAILLAPQMEEAHYRLAQAYRASGDAGEAKAEFHLYQQLAKESAENEERERHEIRQFVYTLRDQPAPQTP